MNIFNYFVIFIFLFGITLCQDLDGDGFYQTNQYSQLVDCCDTVDLCPNPYLVNPAAQEILGNGIDDNCDGYIDIPETCASYPNPTAIPQFTFSSGSETAQIPGSLDIYSCSSGINQQYWGFQALYDAVLLLANGNPNGVSGPSQTQVAIMNNFGNVGPIKGNTFFLMSTGQARNPGDVNYDQTTYGNTNLGNSVVSPPAEWVAQHPTVPRSPTCGIKKSDIEKRDINYGYYYGGIETYAYTYYTPYTNYYTAPASNNKVYDSVRLRFTFKQPSNFNAFAFKVKFGTSAKEMPVIHPCVQYNDYFIVIKETPATGGNLPPDHNIAKTPLGYDFESYDKLDTFYTNCIPATNTQGPCGKGNFDLGNSCMTGSTSWSYIGSHASPQEIFNISFVLWDTGNAQIDSQAMIDGYAPVAEVLSGTTYASGYFPTSDIELFSAIPSAASISTSLTTPPTITYRITVKNNGPETASNVYVSYTPVRNTTHVSSTLSTCSNLPPSGATFPLVKCQLNTASIASGSTFTFTITVKVDVGFLGQLRNSFWATCSSVNLDASNDFKFTSVTVHP